MRDNGARRASREPAASSAADIVRTSCFMWAVRLDYGNWLARFNSGRRAHLLNLATADAARVGGGRHAFRRVLPDDRLHVAVRLHATQPVTAFQQRFLLR